MEAFWNEIDAYMVNRITAALGEDSPFAEDLPVLTVQPALIADVDRWAKFDLPAVLVIGRYREYEDSDSGRAGKANYVTPLRYVLAVAAKGTETQIASDLKTLEARLSNELRTPPYAPKLDDAQFSNGGQFRIKIVFSEIKAYHTDSAQAGTLLGVCTVGVELSVRLA